jgi:hypothetical protein
MFDELDSLLDESLQQKAARKRTVYKEKYSKIIYFCYTF